MIYAGLLSAHRLFPAWWWLGMRKTWLRGHLWLGSLSVVLIACHAHGELGSHRLVWLARPLLDVLEGRGRS